MRQSKFRPECFGIRLRSWQQANTRTAVLLLVLFLAGVAVGGFWLYRSTRAWSAANANNEGGQNLTDSTKAVLKRLDLPVEIRFYALLDPASISPSVQAFAGRVDQLLSAYEQEANGKINVTRYNYGSDIDAAAAAAAADGFKPFNLNKGNACYLGLAVTQNKQKESLPQLVPEWEQALEFDLARAIERVASVKHPTQSLANKSPTYPADVEEVKRTVPNFASVSLEEGTRILREAALKDFKAAAGAMEIQVKEAQQRLSQAQNSGSETEQQTAMKHLQQVQSEHTEAFKQIAAKSAAQIEALRQLKEAAH